ncbi:hypothetical protein GQX74_010366 [Glossina fuscipes]|nr:hypothetical protein GQX74_010366 [Glossina fuscipes]
MYGERKNWYGGDAMKPWMYFEKLFKCYEVGFKAKTTSRQLERITPNSSASKPGTNNNLANQQQIIYLMICSISFPLVLTKVNCQVLRKLKRSMCNSNSERTDITSSIIKKNIYFIPHSLKTALLNVRENIKRISINYEGHNPKQYQTCDDA